jgi:glycosyltransferase involved in cell wall biosynthesis
MVTGAYYPELSGAGLQCRALVRALRANVDFVVFTTTAERSLPAVDERDGVPVFRVGVRPERILSKLVGLWQFVRLFVTKRDSFSVVHLHGFSQKSVPFMALAWLFGKAVVVKLTSVGHDDPVAMRRRGWWAYWWYSRASLFVAVSPRLRELYEEAGLPPARFKLIANGVDTNRFRPARANERFGLRGSLGLPRDGSVVLFVGFFSRDKCPDLLFEAWRRITQGQLARATLVFVGATRSEYYEIDQDLVARLRRDARELDGGRRSVVFVESTHEIEKFYRTADVFVMPSIREGLPNALLEAMASGLGCIASRLEGVTDTLLQNGVTGRLVEPYDEDALEEALRLLLVHPSLARAMGRQARAAVEANFALEDTGRQYLGAYQSLTTATKPCAGSQA